MKIPFFLLSFCWMGLFGTNSYLPILSINGCKEADSSKTGNSSTNQTSKIFTPEMYGATGDGSMHKISERYKTLSEATKEYPGVKDLEISLDGAAFQKAINMASANNGTVIAEKKYVINYPLQTRNNLTIDGKGNGKITNDNTRDKDILHIAFLMGNYNAVAFVKLNNDNAGFNLYKVSGAIKAGQQFAEIAEKSELSNFHIGQIVMLSSALKRRQGDKKILLPYHITVSKIVKIDNGKLYFEYPIDENVESAEIAANGNYDPLAETAFEAVENVTIRNMAFNAEHITLRTYAYNCHLENLKIENGIRLIGVNAFSRSTIKNISGTFGWRGIEIKTGTDHLEIKNVSGTYKPLENFTATLDMISFGEYCRNVTLDSFVFDCGDVAMRHGLITIRSRKNVISNGVVTAKYQKRPFVELFNERYIEDPQFGCYSNRMTNVNFYGGEQMRNLFAIGDDEETSKAGPAKEAPARAYKKKLKNKISQEQDPEGAEEDAIAYEFLANTSPQYNIIENCFFDAGSAKSVATINDGKKNIIRNCKFKKARLIYSQKMKELNTISGISEE